MAGLIPFNRRNELTRTGYDDFYNMVDDFFSDRWLPGRNLVRDTFKLDVTETPTDYTIEAELPGVQKEEISLNADEKTLCISVNREETVNDDGKNYIHRERRLSSMSRSIRLADANLADVKAKLDNGILVVTVPKEQKAAGAHKIDIE